MRPPCKICGSNDHSAPECSAPTLSPGDNDDEFGAPEDIKIDMNRQINHLMQSFSNDNINLHWKISQHAAEIDALKIALAEKEAEVEALSQALEAEVAHSQNLEDQWGARQGKNAKTTLNLAGDPQPAADEFLALASGQPGLASVPAPAEE